MLCHGKFAEAIAVGAAAGESGIKKKELILRTHSSARCTRLFRLSGAMPWWPVLFVMTTFSRQARSLFPGPAALRDAREWGEGQNVAVYSTLLSSMYGSHTRLGDLPIEEVRVRAGWKPDIFSGSWRIRARQIQRPFYGQYGRLRGTPQFPTLRSNSSLPDAFVLSPLSRGVRLLPFCSDSFSLTASHAALSAKVGFLYKNK